MLSRAPRHPALVPFVATMWSSDLASAFAPPARERVLPTGAMHLVFREAELLRLYRDEDDQSGWTVGDCLVGGARAAPYFRDVGAAGGSVGVQLRPGASELLFGVPADALSGQHTRLDDLWGARAEETRQCLFDEPSPARRLNILEAILAQRIGARDPRRPAVIMALRRLDRGASLASIVEDSGHSHRHLVALFRRAVGLSPKVYARILRFQSTLDAMRVKPAAPLIHVALTAGYSDQAHFCRDFREISGTSPSRYRAASPAQPNHVRIGAHECDVTSISFKTPT